MGKFLKLLSAFFWDLSPELLKTSVCVCMCGWSKQFLAEENLITYSNSVANWQFRWGWNIMFGWLCLKAFDCVLLNRNWEVKYAKWTLLTFQNFPPTWLIQTSQCLVLNFSHYVGKLKVSFYFVLETERYIHIFMVKLLA